MQELTSNPQTTSPYTPVGGMRPTLGNPPVLGQQVPGRTGGLPAQGGLSVASNPLAQPLQPQAPQAPNAQAQQLQSYGRGDDSMLIHMTPDEVNSLQGLAMAHGGSLTINPETGLPEAGWLGKLLPTILGAALAATGVGAPLAAGIVGAGQFARTGSLKKGLMAGLGAFGGAGMAGMAGVGGKLAGGNAFGLLSDKAGMFGANMGLGAAIPQGIASGITSTAPTLGTVAPSAATTGGVQTVTGAVIDPTLSINALGPINPGAATALQGGGAQFTGGLGSRFGQAVRSGLPAGTPGIIAKNAPMVAGMGALSNISSAAQPKMKTYNPDEEGYQFKYEGPYRTIPRKFDPRVEGEGEIQFFDEVNPRGFLTAAGERRGYAEGGTTKGGDKSMTMDEAQTIQDRYYEMLRGPRTDMLPPEQLKEFESVQSRVDEANKLLNYTGGNSTSKTGGVTPGTGTGATLANQGVKPPEEKISVDTFKTTIDPTMGGVTPGTGTAATLTDRPDIPGATYDSPGVQTLKDLYTPQFTKQDDFVTAKRDPYTMGSELFAQLPAATARYETSPGAITASRTYAGGSPSERIRAAAQANAAARAAAAGTITAPPIMAGASTTPGTGGELDFGMLAPTGAGAGASTSPSGYGPGYGAGYGPGYGAGYGGFTGYGGYGATAATQPNQNAGTVMDAGNVGGEMDYGFTPVGQQQQQVNPNANLASLVGTDEFFDALNAQYGGGGGGGGGGRDSVEFGMPHSQELARGGPVNMRNGSFVVDARTVSELGNGSSNAGMELLSRLGGQPLQGPGDGVSDSIRARIGGKQEARVARDEVLMPPEAVRRMGGGNEKRGTAKLYALMNKAHKARKKAKRGQDTKVRKGLA